MLLKLALSAIVSHPDPNINDQDGDVGDQDSCNESQVEPALSESDARVCIVRRKAHRVEATGQVKVLVDHIQDVMSSALHGPN